MRRASSGGSLRAPRRQMALGRVRTIGRHVVASRSQPTAAAGRAPDSTGSTTTHREPPSAFNAGTEVRISLAPLTYSQGQKRALCCLVAVRILSQSYGNCIGVATITIPTATEQESALFDPDTTPLHPAVARSARQSTAWRSPWGWLRRLPGAGPIRRQPRGPFRRLE